MNPTQSLSKRVLAALKAAPPSKRNDKFVVFPGGKSYPRWYIDAAIARIEARLSTCEACGERHPVPHMSICAECDEAETRRAERQRDDFDRAYDAWKDDGIYYRGRHP